MYLSSIIRQTWAETHAPGVRARELLGGAPFVDGEELGAVRAPELAEAVHRHTRRARHELQEARSLLDRERKQRLRARAHEPTFYGKC